MKEKMIILLNKLSPSDFLKVRQLYRMTNKITGDTVNEFADNVPNEKTM